MMKHVLITGIHGFSGGHLKNLLVEKAVDICGLDLQGSSQFQGIDYVQCNLLEREVIAAIIADRQPEMIFHLAGRLRKWIDDCRLMIG